LARKLESRIFYHNIQRILVQTLLIKSLRGFIGMSKFNLIIQLFFQYLNVLIFLVRKIKSSGFIDYNELIIFFLFFSENKHEFLKLLLKHKADPTQKGWVRIQDKLRQVSPLELANHYLNLHDKVKISNFL